MYGLAVYIRVGQLTKKLCHTSNSKQNCMRNHPKRYLLEIQRFGPPGFGLKLRCQDPIRPHTITQLQAKILESQTFELPKDIFWGGSSYNFAWN